MNAFRKSASQALFAARRTLSTAAAGAGPEAQKSGFKDTWAVAEAIPLVVMVVIPSCFGVYTTGRFALTHTECKWSKETKSEGVAAWYDDKYPGTRAAVRSGAKYSKSH